MTDQTAAEVCCDECTRAGRTSYTAQARFHVDKAVEYAGKSRAHANEATRYAAEAAAGAKKVKRLAAFAAVLVVIATAFLFV